MRHGEGLHTMELALFAIIILSSSYHYHIMVISPSYHQKGLQWDEGGGKLSLYFQQLRSIAPTGFSPHSLAAGSLQHGHGLL